MHPFLYRSIFLFLFILIQLQRQRAFFYLHISKTLESLQVVVDFCVWVLYCDIYIASLCFVAYCTHYEALPHSVCTVIFSFRHSDAKVQLQCGLFSEHQTSHSASCIVSQMKMAIIIAPRRWLVSSSFRSKWARISFKCNTFWVLWDCRANYSCCM